MNLRALDENPAPPQVDLEVTDRQIVVGAGVERRDLVVRRRARRLRRDAFLDYIDQIQARGALLFRKNTVVADVPYLLKH